MSLPTKSAEELQRIGMEQIRSGGVAPFIYPTQVAQYVEWQAPHVVVKFIPLQNK